MEEIIKKLEGRIEVLKKCRLAEYEIKAPYFEKAKNSLNVETIDIEELDRMLLLYEFREYPISMFIDLVNAYEEQKDSTFLENMNSKGELPFFKTTNRKSKKIDIDAFEDFYVYDDEENEKEYDVDSEEFHKKMKESFAMVSKKDGKFLSVIKRAKKDFSNMHFKEYKDDMLEVLKKYDVLHYYTDLTDYYWELVEKNKKHKSKVRKEIKYLIALKEGLSNLKEQYSLFDEGDFETIYLLAGEDYKKVGEEILKIQEEKWNRLNSEKVNLEKVVDFSKYNAIFLPFHIDFESLDQDIKEYIINEVEIDALVKKMSLLQVENEKNFDIDFIDCVLNTSDKILNGLVYLYHHDLITKEKMMKNIEDYVIDFDNINKNAFKMMRHGVSYKQEKYDEDILFVPEKEIENNEKLLNVYRKQVSSGDYNYLEDAKGFDVLDCLIENNIDLYSFDSYLLEGKEIDQFIKRMHICNELDIDIYTKSGNLNRSFLLGNKFYCKEDILDDYVLISNYENKEIDDFIRNNNRNHIHPNINKIKEFNKLEEYKTEDGLSYDIDGTLISRPKVMRNLTLFYELNKVDHDTILQSIIYNSNLNDGEISSIYNKLFEKEKIIDKK